MRPNILVTGITTLLWSHVLCVNVNQDQQCACASNDNQSVIKSFSSCDPSNATACAEKCIGLHGNVNGTGSDNDFLADKCCIYAGRTASFLAFEEDSQWVPRIDEFRKCTGASVHLTYLPEGEDGMAKALLTDVGDSYNIKGEGIYDAYIVQGPMIPNVVGNLANLSPFIRKHASTIQFTDINQASRNAVSYNGTVRALPLDTDYIALGWREDVFKKNNISTYFGKGRINDMLPPSTIDDLADLAEHLNHKDHNDDQQGDWGICLTPQPNYFLAFLAPLFQTNLKDPITGATTGQNIFFDTDTFKPLIRLPGFKKAVQIYYRIILASNCRTQIPNGQKCSRKSAFQTGRCPMVVSMPGTLTKMLLYNASYAPRDRIDGWSVQNQALLNGNGTGYWGRRARFPGSTYVQSWDTDNNNSNKNNNDNNNNNSPELVPCQRDNCPLAGDDLVNYAPFFSEGGEAYALNGRSSSPVQNIMWDMFAWLSTLPIDKLPLSGQYRKSQLSDDSRRDLQERAEWPTQMVDDLFHVLSDYFKSEDEGGNPVQDLFLPGFEDYMHALDEELHGKLFNVGKEAYAPPDGEDIWPWAGGLFNRRRPELSVTPQNDPELFDKAYDIFIDNLEERYDRVTKERGGIEQLMRWRQSLNLPWKEKAQLCKDALVKDPDSFFGRLNCPHHADIEALCLNPSDAKILIEHSAGYCSNNDGKGSNSMIIVAVLVPLLVLVVIAGYTCMKATKTSGDNIWEVKLDELRFGDPAVIVGRGTFGLVLLAEYRGTSVAVKRVIPPEVEDDYKGKNNGGLASTTIHTSGGFSTGGYSGSYDLRKSFGVGDPHIHEDVHQDLQKIMINKSSTNNVNVNGSESGLEDDLEDEPGSLRKSSSERNRKPKRMLKSRNVDYHEKLKSNFICEMRHLSTLRHPCITTVMGAVIDKKEEPMLVMEYMDYGSLYDILHNDTMPFEGDLLLPILRDIAQGIRFLHAAEPQVIHGDLKAANILVDSNFRAKVADFGLSQKRENGATGTPFWMAPELLRGESENTAASDVYSFGIILYEVYSRNDPYSGEHLLEVINEIIDTDVMKRPIVPDVIPPMVGNMMEECLLDDPDARPTFMEMDLRLKRLTAESVEPGNMNFSVQTRGTKERRANELLYDIFPPHIADALRDGRKVEQEHHECVTIYFSDIVGFTTISQMLTPEKVCNMLDRLYQRFDELSRKHDVFKIETIGDAYMAITNLVKNQTNIHVNILAEFSKDTIKAARNTQIDIDDISKGFVEIRVGFHSGPVISDVVGSRLPKFGVFGDTVNTASRMESNSLPNCIHCSESSAKLLQVQAPNIDIESRGGIMIKGKGIMNTYWVDKEQDSRV